MAHRHREQEKCGNRFAFWAGIGDADSAIAVFFNYIMRYQGHGGFGNAEPQELAYLLAQPIRSHSISSFSTDAFIVEPPNAPITGALARPVLALVRQCVSPAATSAQARLEPP